MKRRQSMKIAVDITMSLALVAVMATALVQEVPHEWLGAALFVLMVVHMVQNRRWLGSILRGRYNLLRTLQVIALVGLVACFVGQVASSVVLSKYAFGFFPHCQVQAGRVAYTWCALIGCLCLPLHTWGYTLGYRARWHPSNSGPFVSQRRSSHAMAFILLSNWGCFRIS